MPPPSGPATNMRTPARCSTSPGGTTTGSTARAAHRAGTTTCAWPRRATTPRPAWAAPTGSAPSRRIPELVTYSAVLAGPGEVDHPAGDIDRVVAKALVEAGHQRHLHRHR